MENIATDIFLYNRIAELKKNEKKNESYRIRWNFIELLTDLYTLYPFPVQNWIASTICFERTDSRTLPYPKFIGWDVLPPNYPYVIQYESGMKQVSILILTISLSQEFIRCSTFVAIPCYFFLRFYHVKLL